jgi:hypothetical protein
MIKQKNIDDPFNGLSRAQAAEFLLSDLPQHTKTHLLTCPTTCATDWGSWNARLRPEPPRRQREFAKLVRSLQQ